MSFSCSNLLQSPSFARGGALHASSSSKTHKTKAAFAVRAAEDGTYFIVKPMTRNFFDLSRAKARRTKEVAMSASEKRTHPKKTRFPPRAKEATRTSRRGRVDGLSPRARTIFCTSLVEKKPQKRITFCGTKEGERKRDSRVAGKEGPL